MFLLAMNYVVKKGQYIFNVSVLSQKQGYIFLRERKHVFSIKKTHPQIRPNCHINPLPSPGADDPSG